MISKIWRQYPLKLHSMNIYSEKMIFIIISWTRNISEEFFYATASTFMNSLQQFQNGIKHSCFLMSKHSPFKFISFVFGIYFLWKNKGSMNEETMCANSKLLSSFLISLQDALRKNFLTQTSKSDFVDSIF